MICDSCDLEINSSDLIMLTDEWFVCKKCYESKSSGKCEYSSYCNYTGECNDEC